MPGEAFGLYTHQRNNRTRSIALIIGLFLMVYLTAWGMMLVGYGYVGVPRGRTVMGFVNQRFWSWLPLITLATGAWVFVGFQVNVKLIEAVSGAEGVTRAAVESK